MDPQSATGLLHSEESKQKNYLVVNQPTKKQQQKGGVLCTRLSIIVMAICGLLILLTAIGVTYLLTSHLVTAETSDHTSAPTPLIARNADVYGRLPRNIHPSQYRIMLMPYIEEENFTTDGHLTMWFTCLENSDNITLNINDIEIDEESVTVIETRESTQINIKQHKYDTDGQTYTVMLNEDLAEGQNYTINIHYTAHLNDLLQGFYRSFYIDSATNEKRWMASTQFSPTDARRAFPCLDEPDRKARFTISIGRNQRKHHTLSNMKIKHTERIPNRVDWSWDHYETTPLMSTYLVGFIVSDLIPLNLSKTPSNLPFTVWARRDAINQTVYAHMIGPKILKYFENYFGIPYPLPKQDMVAIPDFGFNAMENWGLITFRESAMLYDEKTSTSESKQKVLVVVAHELGHQWFGNLVTPKWWDDLWLKEGFATYLEYLGAHHVEPKWKLLDQFVLDEVHNAFQLDALASSHPISQPVQHSREIRQIFDSISYKKGAALIRMMSHFLGESTFKTGLTNYLNEHKYGNAEQDELWEALNEQAEIDNKLPKNLTIKTIMDSWTLQKGYPLLTVKRNYEQRTAEINQDKFLINKVSTDDLTMWYVPITYTTQQKSNFENTSTKVWMTDTSQEISISDDGWVMINLNNVGFYRVNYDDKNWGMLTRSFNDLPELSRAQLIDDALNIARSGQLDYNLAFNILKELTREIQYMPWNAAERSIKYLDNMLITSPSYGEFKVFILEILSNVKEKLGFNENPSDDHVTLMNRAQILKMACAFGEPHCIMTSRLQFREWMMDSTQNKIVANLKPVVYCTAIAEGDQEEWNFAFEQYLNSNVGSDKEVLLDALGCATKPWLLSRYLNLSITENSGIRKQDGARVFSGVARNIVGFPIAIDFFKGNWDTINKYYGEAFSTVSKMVDSLHIFMNTASQLKGLKDFKNEHKESLGTTERSFNGVVEKVTGNIIWMKNCYPSVEKWLKNVNKVYGLT